MLGYDDNSQKGSPCRLEDESRSSRLTQQDAAVKIEELFVEGFGDWANLQLPKFRSGLNVIRVPSKEDSDLLRGCFELALVSQDKPVRPRKAVQANRIEVAFGHEGEAITRQLVVDKTDDEVRFTGTLPWNTANPNHEDVVAALTQTFHDPASIARFGQRFLVGDVQNRPKTKSRPKIDLRAERRKLFDLQNDLEDLLAKRAKLCKLQEPDESIENYFRDQLDLADLQDQKNQLAKRCQALSREQQVLNSAVELSELWLHREKIKRQLKKVHPVNPSSLKQLDELNDRLRKCRHLQKKIRRQLRKANQETKPTKRDDPRIVAALAQEDWVYETKATIDKLRDRIEQYENNSTSLGSDRERQTNNEKARALKPYASALRAAKRDLDNEERRFASLQTEFDSYADSQTRRDRDVDNDEPFDEMQYRLQQLAQQREHVQREIEELRVESSQLLKRQTLPLRILLALAALFAAGIAMVFAGLYLEMNGVEWACIAMGMTAAAAAALLRISYTRSNSERIRNYRRRITLLTEAIDDNHRQVDALRAGDRSSLANRFVSVEDEDDPTQSFISDQLSHHLDSVMTSVDDYQTKYDRARRRWEDALEKNGFSRRLSPQQVIDQLRESAGIRKRHRRDSSRVEVEIDKLRAELKLNEKWIRQWRDDTATLIQGHEVSDRMGVDGILSLLKRDRADFSEEIDTSGRNSEAERLRVDLQRTDKKMKQITRERRQLLESARCKNESEFRQRAAESKRRKRLETELTEAKAKVARRLAEDQFGDEVKQLLAERKAVEIVQESAERANALRDAQHQLQQLQDQINQKRRRFESQVDVEQLAAHKLDLEVTESRLGQVRRNWQRQVLWMQSAKLLGKQPESDERPQYYRLKELDAILPALTSGRIVGLRFSSDVRTNETNGTESSVNQVLCETKNGNLTLQQLEKADRAAVSLGTRLAVHRSLAEHEVFPLVIGDALLMGLNANRSQVVRVLQDSAERGLQLFVVSANRKLIDACLAERIPVAFVSREIDKRTHLTSPTVANEFSEEEQSFEHASRSVEPETSRIQTVAASDRTSERWENFHPSGSELDRLSYQHSIDVNGFPGIPFAPIERRSPEVIDRSTGYRHLETDRIAPEPPVEVDSSHAYQRRQAAESLVATGYEPVGASYLPEELPRLGGSEPAKLGHFRLDDGIEAPIPDHHFRSRPSRIERHASDAEMGDVEVGDSEPVWTD